MTAEQTGEKVRGFFCPCHRATFDLAGKRLQATSHSPRDLDTLAAEVRNGTEVWVQFQNFKLGLPQTRTVTRYTLRLPEAPERLILLDTTGYSDEALAEEAWRDTVAALER